MGNITGWTKSVLTKNEWNSNNSRNYIRVKGTKFELRSDSRGDRLITGRKFQTKTLALKFAIRYMRSHPRG